MNCPKCGAPLKEEAKFCVACGLSLEDAENTVSNQYPITENTQENNQPENISLPKQQKQPRKANLIGLIVGTVLIVIGFIRIFSADPYLSGASFGADFYTYAYRGLVEIVDLLGSIEISLGWLIVAIGAAIDIFSLHK